MLLYLPAAGPELSAVEVRGQAKYGLAAPGFCAALDGLKDAVRGHFGTCAIKAGIYRYLMRSLWGEIFTARQYCAESRVPAGCR